MHARRRLSLQLRVRCSCTGYAIKHRMLREHRVLMRCMEAIIVENGLDAELGELWENNRDPRPGRDIASTMTPSWTSSATQKIPSSSSVPSWPTEVPWSRPSRGHLNAAR